MPHPSEEQLALFAGNDLGWLARRRVAGHLTSCGDCQSSVVAYSSLRAEILDGADQLQDALPWNQMAAEMRANIRLGLAAGECVNARAGVRASSPRLIAVLASFTILIAAAWVLNYPAAAPHSAEPFTLQTSGGGIAVSEGSQLRSVLHSRGKDVVYSVGAKGQVGARYVDDETGYVTVNNVYLQ